MGKPRRIQMGKAIKRSLARKARSETAPTILRIRVNWAAAPLVSLPRTADNKFRPRSVCLGTLSFHLPSFDARGGGPRRGGG